MELIIHEIFQFFLGFNFRTLLGMAVVFWFFHRRMKTQENRNEQRIDRLYEMFIEFQKDYDYKFLEILKKKIE